jgi:hypothetical protein
MELGSVISWVRTAFSGLLTLLRIKASLSTPPITFFFAVREDYASSKPLSRKDFQEELKPFERNGRWLEIHIKIANNTGQNLTIESLAIHAGKSPVPLANLTFGGEGLPHRLKTNESASWNVDIKDLAQRVKQFPTDFASWPNLNLFAKLGNGKSVRARPGISTKVWEKVLTIWKASM